MPPYSGASSHPSSAKLRFVRAHLMRPSCAGHIPVNFIFDCESSVGLHLLHRRSTVVGAHVDSDGADICVAVLRYVLRLVFNCCVPSSKR